ncbi:hypothetical protein [Devosia sp.]|uniref:hypothetical protein n=1 Tax=Devosia sp. TaxID=1871048 RepID=UPI002622775E|nr:hypothetical protein [Devosia sp.]
MDLDVHGLARTCWGDDDLFDHRPQAFEDDVARLALADAVEVGTQLGDDLSVALRGRGVQDDRFVVYGQIEGLGPQCLALCLEAAQTVQQGIGDPSGDHKVDKRFDLSVEVGKAVC